MVDDISNKLADALKKMRRDIIRLQSARPLENTAIRSGRLRLIGALLRIDSGGRLEVIGTWRFVGAGAITGDVVAEGKWTQNGSWELNGPGDIAGDVDLTGNFDLTGVFTSGNVRIEDGKIYVGTGANQIVIDGATGNIIAGAMRIDPSASGGAVVFNTGAELRSEGDLTWLVHGNNGVAVDGSQVIVRYGARQLRIASDGVKITGLPTRTGTALPSGAVGADADGTLWRAA
ncbi:hypothetical protein M2317_002931 [Microbacterium sp. ZKA21]|uniref:hypothetical protein n=1 Tax=Microbacterium sp. ZKA21 TaxID=3381694 RepID=UPI003D1F2F05